jgi:hypothetical protein
MTYRTFLSMGIFVLEHFEEIAHGVEHEGTKALFE